jgi:DNA recombination protein RmuC
MNEMIVYGLLGVSCVFSLGACRLASRAGAQSKDDLEAVRRQTADELRATRQEIAQSVQGGLVGLSNALSEAQKQAGGLQDKRLEALTEQFSQRSETLQRTVTDMLGRVDKRFESFSVQSEQRLEGDRTTGENRLTAMQEDNGRRLEQMRATVDEKLQKTLDERLTQSFGQVSQRLEEVYKGLGEMQTLAAGVGDLKRVLSNVKSRGILGELQLGAILEQILSPEQYAKNVVTKKGSQNPVEYAICLPGDGEGYVWLPVDAKFHADAYTQLLEAYERADAAAAEQAGKELERRIKAAAKDIRDKYIDPPATTDFGILFLPFEGLYAEVVRRGLIETLQRDYHINIAGPTTMGAFLNSLQMGFRTLAIQKRSGEVWQVLRAVRTEFDKFGDTLEAAQRRLDQAGRELDSLVGTRTRQIQRRLKGVTSLSEPEARAVLLEAGEAEEEEGI